jgi:hypothetical protein
LVEETLDDVAEVELAAGVDEEERSELDLELLSPEDDEPPSPEFDPPSFEPLSLELLSEFGADEDLDG